MIDTDWKINLTEMMQGNYTDLDIYRRKPEMFRSGNYAIVIAPVTLEKHDKLLNDIGVLLYRYHPIFENLEFLSHSNYKDQNELSKLIEQMNVFNLTQPYFYSKFKKEAMKFILKWAYVIKIPNHISDNENNPTKIDLMKSKRICKKVLNKTAPDTFIKILFLIFVYNFDLVKKNTLEFLKMFQRKSQEETKSDISFSGNKGKVVPMPKYSKKPFNKSALNSLEKQSRLK